jgi:hypothetical protein
VLELVAHIIIVEFAPIFLVVWWWPEQQSRKFTKPNETQDEPRLRGARLKNSRTVLAIKNVDAQQVAIGCSVWLGHNFVKPMLNRLIKLSGSEKVNDHKISEKIDANNRQENDALFANELQHRPQSVKPEHLNASHRRKWNRQW